MLKKIPVTFLNPIFSKLLSKEIIKTVFPNYICILNENFPLEGVTKVLLAVIILKTQTKPAYIF